MGLPASSDRFLNRLDGQASLLLSPRLSDGAIVKIETDPEQQDYSASSRARDAAAEGPACEPSPVPRRSLAWRASLALALLLSVSALALALWFGVHGL